MAAALTGSSPDSDSNVRKRVCKACDRCRLKKSKCDGVTPCSRCRADNAICVFGERKKSHDKVYPKGYVEMLEQQQIQLVNGLQELYQRSIAGESWDGPILTEGENGKPLTHDILDHLGVLQQDDSSSRPASFDDNFESMQQRLIDEGADLVPRRGSEDSEDREMSGRPAIENSTRRLAGSPLSPQRASPVASSPQPSPLWRTRTKPSPLSSRPQSVQIHPGYAWEPDMKMEQDTNPVLQVHVQTWGESPTVFEEGAVDFMQGYGEPFDRMSGLQPQNFVSAPGVSPQLSYMTQAPRMDVTMPMWTEEDYNAFLN